MRTHIACCLLRELAVLSRQPSKDSAASPYSRPAAEPFAGSRPNSPIAVGKRNSAMLPPLPGLGLPSPAMGPAASGSSTALLSGLPALPAISGLPTSPEPSSSNASAPISRASLGTASSKPDASPAARDREGSFALPPPPAGYASPRGSGSAPAGSTSVVSKSLFPPPSGNKGSAPQTNSSTSSSSSNTDTHADSTAQPNPALNLRTGDKPLAALPSLPDMPAMNFGYASPAGRPVTPRKVSGSGSRKGSGSEPGAAGAAGHQHSASGQPSQAHRGSNSSASGAGGQRGSGAPPRSWEEYRGRGY